MKTKIIVLSILAGLFQAGLAYAQTQQTQTVVQQPANSGVPGAPGAAPAVTTTTTTTSAPVGQAPQPGQYAGYAPSVVAAPNPYAQAQVPAQGYYPPPAGYESATSLPPQAPPSSLPPLPSDFEAGVQNNLGMTPSQIRQLRQLLDDRQRAAAEMPNPPRSVTGSISVSLSPGASPPVVRPFYGVSTSIVILDSSGSPWPVENFSVGNRSLFQVDRLDGPSGSSFVISPLQTYGQSNLIFKLAGAPTPVVITLVSGQKIHDARIEARVQGRGPNAQVSSVSLTPGIDSRLLSVLDGVPPSGRSVPVEGDAGSKAWAMPNGRIWLRTNLTVVSPAPISFVSAADGTKVYELMPSARVLGMMNDQFVTLNLNGCLQECAVSGQGW